MAEIAAIRTVRGFDTRPGDAGREQKRVGDILIERGVPIPPRHQDRTKSILAALRAMEVNESFVWRKRVNTDALRQAAPRKFVQRKVGKGPQYRIWRTA